MHVYTALKGAVLTSPYDIDILLLCHTDEILSRTYEIEIVQSKYEKTHHKLQQKQNDHRLVGNFV